MRSVIAGPTKNDAGFTLIDMLFVIALIGLVSTLAIPGLMRARGAAQSASALGTMRVVNSAQLSFAITCGLGFYSPDFQTLGVKPPAAIDAFLAPELATGPTFIKSGYNFSMAGTALPARRQRATASGAGQSRPATPRSPTSSTRRHRAASSARMPTASFTSTPRASRDHARIGRTAGRGAAQVETQLLEVRCRRFGAKRWPRATSPQPAVFSGYGN